VIAVSNGRSLLMLAAMMIAGMVPAWESGTVWDFQGMAMAGTGMTGLFQLMVIGRM
jgi:hypothetical protein